MGGIILARPEFLVLMDAVQAPGVVGLDVLELVPQDAEEHKAVVAAGIQQLKERGALSVQDGINVLDTTLLGMAMVIADPELALITMRDTPDVGGQLFLHYKAQDLVVEQTLPSEEEHRLALMSQAELVDRIVEILPLHASSTDADGRAVLEQDAFIEVKDLVEAGDASKASKVLAKQRVEGGFAESLLASMTAPEFGGTVAILRCKQGQVVDARNLAVIQGSEAAWLVCQAEPASAGFEVSACDEGMMRSLLSDWIGELSA
jgi:hypothetical protein